MSGAEATGCCGYAFDKLRSLGLLRSISLSEPSTFARGKPIIHSPINRPHHYTPHPPSRQVETIPLPPPPFGSCNHIAAGFQQASLRAASSASN